MVTGDVGGGDGARRARGARGARGAAPRALLQAALRGAARARALLRVRGQAAHAA